MSYDLCLYKKSTNRISLEEIKSFLFTKFIYWKADNEYVWTYQNEETGVYCQIYLDDRSFVVDESEQYNFEGFDNLGLTFNVNFIRPDFFGYEVFPMIDEMVETLDLYVLNHSDNIEEPIPIQYPKNYSRDQWLSINQGINKSNFDQFNTNYLPLDISQKIWNYQKQRAQLQNKVGDDIFVVGYFLLKSLNDQQIYRVGVWPYHIPIIFPPLDYFIIQQKHNKLFKTEESKGLVSMKQIKEQLGNYIEDYESEITDLKIVKPASSNKIKKIFNELTIEYDHLSFGKLLSFDEFINHQP